MLVLTRKIGEAIHVGNDMEVVVLEVKGGRVKLGFAAPRDVQIRRSELPEVSQFGTGDSPMPTPSRPLAAVEADRSPFTPALAFETAGSGA